MGNKTISLKNIHFALLIRILIILSIFTICRILFYLFNYEYFTVINIESLIKILVGGLLYDLSAIVQINSIFIILNIIPFRFRGNRIYQIICEYLFYIVNSAAIILNCADIAYYPFILKRSTYDIFTYISIGDGSDFFKLLPRYIFDFWYISILIIILIFLMIFSYKKTIKKIESVGGNIIFYIKNILIGILILFIGVIASRGGLQLRPINIISASKFATVNNIPLVLNTPFSIINTINKQKLRNYNYFSEAKAESIYCTKHCYAKNSDTLKKINIVIIIFESLTNEYSAKLNINGSKTTYVPFLDSLMEYSLTCTKAYANGNKSIEGVPAIISSIPGLMSNPFLTSIYAGNKISALPVLLKRQGYSSAFFHGGTNGTMLFDAFANSAEFNNYYGRTEYNNENDFDGKWGIFDEEFLQYTAHKIGEMPEPFIASVFTLSSHHPYTIPLKYKGKFSKGKLEIHESIQYCDYSLSKFFKTISKMPCYKNTLFIITSDHTSLTEEKFYKTPGGALSIPIIYFQPDSVLKGTYEHTTQQIDILPSILDYINYPDYFFAFGQSIFDSAALKFNISYANEIFQLTTGGKTYLFDGQKIISEIDYTKIFNYTNKYDHEIKTTAEDLIKAIIQTYSLKMNENKLILAND